MLTVIKRLYSIIRAMSFAAMMSVMLAAALIGVGGWALSLSAQVATMTAAAATAAIAQRKAVAKAIARTRARARLRRLVVAIPVVGAAAMIAFERSDFLEWKEENPDGTAEDYGCEIAVMSGEVVDEVLQDLPERVRPSRELVMDRLPECRAGHPGAVSEGNDGT